jgi:hypothetical protein
VDAHVPEGRLRKRWGSIAGEQEGENPAFRAGKGQVFPTCAPLEGQRESKGAKGYEGSTTEFKIVLKEFKIVLKN